MGDTVQKIKDRLSIVDVVGGYVELHKAGKNYKGKSPFTSEKTPSFYVSPDRGMYYCFSSNQGGDIFTFIQTMEGVDFKGALKILADKAGVELVREDPKKRTERDALYALIEDATKFFFQEGTNHKTAQDYILGRGVDGKTLHTWRIGFAPDDWRALRSHLTEKKYTDEQMIKAGLIKRADGGKEPYDVFRNRIMFPIFDASGRVVAFSGRTLSQDKETPKYVNSPETELYQKSDILFGYDKAKQGIRKLDFSLLVEGQFDLVLAHQAGYGNTVAVSGTALTAHHIDLLQRLSNRAVLALDSDRAGIAAMKRAAQMMLAKGMDVKAVRIAGGKDPADIIKEDAARFKKMVGESKHVLECLLDIFKEEAKDERTYKLQVREEILPLVAVMPNRIDREHFEGVIAEAIDTTKDAIHFEVSRLESPKPPASRVDTEARQEHKKAASTGHARRVYLFAMKEYLARDERTQHIGNNIEHYLKEICGDTYATEIEALTADSLNPHLMYLEQTNADPLKPDFLDDIATRLDRYYKEILRQQMAEITDAIRAAEQNGAQETHEALLQKYTKLSETFKNVSITKEKLQEK